MGANAQTAVPAFVAGEILTAAEMTQVNTGIPVFSTTTTRDAAFGGAGEKVLAEGQFAYIEATNTTQFYDGAAWQSVGAGIVYITTATLTGSSVSVNNCFSATYDSYLLVYSNISSSATSAIYNRLRVSGTDSTTGYYSHVHQGLYSSNTYAGSGYSNQNHMPTMGATYTAAADASGAFCYIHNPFKASSTTFQFMHGETNTARGVWIGAGFHNVATSYDGITFTMLSGSFNNGTVSIFGVTK